MLSDTSYITIINIINITSNIIVMVATIVIYAIEHICVAIYM